MLTQDAHPKMHDDERGRTKTICNRSLKRTRIRFFVCFDILFFIHILNLFLKNRKPKISFKDYFKNALDKELRDQFK